MRFCRPARIFCLLIVSFVIFLRFGYCQKKGEVAGTENLENNLLLGDDWHIQSSARCIEKGEKISTPAFEPKGWYSASVPTTVLAALVKNGVYKNIYFARNLEKIPSDQFKNSWWYRKEFVIEKPELYKNYRLIFDGINYKANVWFNSKIIASSGKVEGSFRMFEFDITNLIKRGKNILAVEVFPPEKTDLTIGFVDWAPRPPDNNIGIWREVKLRMNGGVSLNNTFVQTEVDMETLDQASILITTHLINHTNNSMSGIVKGVIENVDVSEPYTLKPRERKKIFFNPGKYKSLIFKNPRLWWPNNLGKPDLYSLKMTVTIKEKVSDKQTVRFGIRTVSDYINETGHRGYKINGKKMLIRGAGWVDDLLLVDDHRKIESQIKYVKHMNLNTIRLEGFWGSSQKLYDLADENGILIMIGWSCQWEWTDYCGRPEDDFISIRTPEDIDLHSRGYRDQVVWLRNHPSIFVWVYGSDKLPKVELEKQLNEYLAEEDPTRPILRSCKYKLFGEDKFQVSKIGGPTRVKMLGPYGYVTPNYWYIDTKLGGAYGFNTETGPGPQVPPLESIKKMIPEKDLWPINRMWDFHCGRNEFQTLERYLKAFNQRYGKAGSVEEFAQVSQVSNYEAIRAMFEAFGVNKHDTTGIIQWMLNSAWPEMFWQLYDYYLMPNGAFYGTKKACQPVNIVYNYKDKDIYLVNDLNSAVKNLKAEIRVLNLDAKEVLNKEVQVNIAENMSKKIFPMPEMKGLSPVYFIDLKLKNAEGKEVAGNFYWLSTKEDIPDFENSKWFITPNKAYADFTALKNLAPVRLKVEHTFETRGNEQKVHVTIKNPTDSDAIAFFIELQVKGKTSGRTILPVFWDDNYVSLLPGETKKISAHFSKDDLDGEEPLFDFSGWNVKSSE